MTNKRRYQPSAQKTKLIEVLAYISLGAIATWCYSAVAHNRINNYNGDQVKRKAEKAWTLAVKLTFIAEPDLQSILQEWTKVAKYCADHEKFLLHYEVGISDSDPLVVHILERYQSKEEYLNVHKHGEEFLKFRPILKNMQDEGKVTVEGFSYQELGYGFTTGYGNDLN